MLRYVKTENKPITKSCADDCSAVIDARKEVWDLMANVCSGYNCDIKEGDCDYSVCPVIRK
jgi:hypothetical protein